jgi:hypothetical protein
MESPRLRVNLYSRSVEVFSEQVSFEVLLEQISQSTFGIGWLKCC